MKVRVLVISMLVFFILSNHLFSQKVMYNGLGQSQQNKLIAMSIAGIVNRTEPRLYLLNVYETWSYNQTDEQWRDIYQEEGKFQFRTIININDLIDNFRADIKGTISYDPYLVYSNFSGQSFMWEGEFAAMLGGFTDCIPVPFDNTFIQIEKQEKALVKDYFGTLAELEISARLEDKNHPWSNSELSQESRYLSLINWGLEHVLPRSNPTAFYLREVTDWAVSKRMFQVNLAGTESLRFTSLSTQKAEILERIMTYCKYVNPNKTFNVYGWIRPEPLTQWISAWGGCFHETLLANLSWHHVFPAEKNFSYTRKSIVDDQLVKLENKKYVLFIGSEGDAGNWNFGFQSGAWLSKERGNVPIGWGFNLHFFDQFPFIGQYYFKTATSNDGFIAVTSPLGYAYHDLLPIEVLEEAKARASNLIATYQIPAVYAYKHYNGAGISTYRGVTISNNYDFQKLGSFAKATNTDLTFLFDPKLKTQRLYQEYQGLLYNHVDDETFYANTTNIQAVAEKIIAKLKGMSNGPGFLLAGYQRLRSDDIVINTNNPADITLTRLKSVMQLVGQDPEIGGNVEFVTPEKFTALIKKSLAVTSVLDDDLQNEKPKIYSINNETLKIEFPSADQRSKNYSIFDLTGKELLTITSTDPIIEVNLASKQQKYLLRITDGGRVTSLLFIH